jgi:predicted site-specific integrase-resolvase
MYLTPKQLAARWSVSVHTLAAWRSAGKGPAFIKLGGVRYPLEAVELYEAGKR